MPEDAFQLVGTVVAGVFRVEEVVAEGGFGVVYRAHHQGFNAKVALKCLKIPQHMNEERRTRFKAQFRAEAELLFKLSASIPNIVRPLHIDAITTPNGRFTPFLALEWLEGETLDAMAARKAFSSLEELVELLTPAARAFEQAHHFPSDGGEISIVHRDIKPENLFLADVAGKRVIKILDFGIAKAKSAATQAVGKLSADGAAFTSFTPAFGAPEQWAPRRFGQTGPWTDVWGIALTLLEVWAGRPIVDGDQTAMMEVVLDPTRRPTPRNEGLAVSDDVERVFSKALALDPRDRYQDAGVFWRALCAALESGAEPIPSLAKPQKVRARGSAATEPGPRATQAVGRRFHEELDLGESNVVHGLELASLPPSASREMPVVFDPDPVAAAATSFSDIPLRLAPMSIRPRGSILRECLVPGAAVLSGVLLAVLGQLYAATSGKVFTIGPVGLSWFTVPLVVAGSGVLLWRLIPRGDPTR